jgi:hypothetical protein
VIAQHNLGGGSKLFEIAKNAKGVRAAIDQIPDTPEAVCGRSEPDQFE